jgi:ribosomal-protein-alanine N-acetyltransferase
MSRGGGSGIALREAGPIDVPVIARLHCGCFTDGAGGAVWSAASISKILSLAGSYAYIASIVPGSGPDGPQEAGEPVPAGFLLARAWAGDLDILSLGVVATWRRRGAARALLRAAMARAGIDGARRTQLEVAEDNMAARALYAAEGFAVVSRQAEYYRRSGGAFAAALVFSRNLT